MVVMSQITFSAFGMGLRQGKWSAHMKKRGVVLSSKKLWIQEDKTNNPRIAPAFVVKVVEVDHFEANEVEERLELKKRVLKINGKQLKVGVGQR